MPVSAPTAETIAELSRVDFDAQQLSGTRFQREIDRAVRYVLDACGYADMAAVPDAHAVLFEECVQMRVEQRAFHGSEDHVEMGAEELIASQSAGSVSESRRGLAELAEAKLINRWPALHDVLWRLCTPEKRQEYLDLWQQLADGVNPPAIAFADIVLAPPPGSIDEGWPPWP